MTTSKKRFIAGAVCPRCGEMDRLLIYQCDGASFRECVNCDFHEKLLFQTVRAELDTRVSHTPGEVASQTRVLKLVEPDR